MANVKISALGEASQEALWDIINERSGNEFSLRSFGALGDGTDQTAEIQACYDAARAQQDATDSPQVVIWPEGRYVVSATIRTKGIHSRGRGMGKAMKLSGDFNVWDADVHVIPQIPKSTTTVTGTDITFDEATGLHSSTTDFSGFSPGEYALIEGGPNAWKVIEVLTVAPNHIQHAEGASQGVPWLLETVVTPGDQITLTKLEPVFLEGKGIDRDEGPAPLMEDICIVNEFGNDSGTGGWSAQLGPFGYVIGYKGGNFAGNSEDTPYTRHRMAFYRLACGAVLTSFWAKIDYWAELCCASFRCTQLNADELHLHANKCGDMRTHTCGGSYGSITFQTMDELLLSGWQSRGLRGCNLSVYLEGNANGTYPTRRMMDAFYMHATNLTVNAANVNDNLSESWLRFRSCSLSDARISGVNPAVSGTLLEVGNNCETSTIQRTERSGAPYAPDGHVPLISDNETGPDTAAAGHVEVWIAGVKYKLLHAGTV